MLRRNFRAKQPIIRPAAVQEYLHRELDNFDFLKDVPKEELMQHAHELGMRFATDCWHNQIVCWTIGSMIERFYFLLKQGGGKSKITLDLIRYRKRQGQLKRALICAPELLHMSSWEDQIKEHAPDLTYQLLLGTKGERERMIENPTDICVINHRGLETYMTHLGKVRKGNSVKNKKIISPTAAGEFAARFNFVAFDEFHRLVNDKSMHYMLCMWLSAAADFVYGLSGTPHGRDPTPIFHHFKVIDHGETLGHSIGLFHAAFFNAKKDHWAGIKYTFNRETTSELHRVIKHRSVTYETEELYDVPRCVHIRLPVYLTGESAAYYKRIVQGLAEAKGDYASLGNIFVRMRQCASGFLSLKADDESRIEVAFKDNPKMEALREFLLSKPDEKILVYHEYTHSGRFIEAMLTKEKIEFASIRGGTKNPGAEYARFLNDVKCRVFVLNNRSGSESINPQYVCRRLVFYESPVDPKIREQAERRVYRPGQKYISFIHDLLVQGTVEIKIKKYIKDGKDILRAVMTGKETLAADEEKPRAL